MHERIPNSEQSSCEEAWVQPWLVWQVHLWECLLTLLDKGAGLGSIATVCCEVQTGVRFYQTDWSILGGGCGVHVYDCGSRCTWRDRDYWGCKTQILGCLVNAGWSDFITRSWSAWTLLPIKGCLCKRASHVSQFLHFQHSMCITLSCNHSTKFRIKLRFTLYSSCIADVHSTSIFILCQVCLDYGVKYSAVLGEGANKGQNRAWISKEERGFGYHLT